VRERERDSGLVCEVGRLLVWAARKKKRKEKQARLGWKEGWVRLSCFVFFSNRILLFPFQAFTQNLFKIFKQTFDHTINQNPCIQHDAQALGFSKLINYHCIYLKANLIIQIY
jgi:hypothetical protein